AIAVLDLANRPAGQRLGADVADARSSRNAGEAGIGQNGYMFTEAQMAKGGGDLVNFFHAGAHRSTTDEHEHVSRLEALRSPALDGGDGGPLADEDARGPNLPVNAVGVNDAGIDRRALDHRSFGGQVAARKSHGRC